MNAPFSDVVSPSRLFRTATVLTLAFLLAFPLFAQSPGAAPAGAPAAPAGVGVAAPAAAQATPSGQPAAPQSATPAGAARTGAAAGQAAEATPATASRGPGIKYAQDQLTDFQQLVAGSVGRPLPIFGASLFSGVPSTFAPVTDVAVGPDYVLGPGDEVIVQLSGQINQQFDLKIDRTGVVSVPLLGSVHLAGLPYGQLEDYLRAQFGRVYRQTSRSMPTWAPCVRSRCSW